MKDKRIRTRPAERAAVETYGIRCFCIARGDLTGAEMAAAYVAALPAIYRAAALPGPFIFQVSARGLLRVL